MAGLFWRGRFLSQGSIQRGLVVMEASVWCALLLPLGLIGVSLCALFYDTNTIQALPESFMRETKGRVMTWRSDGEHGFFQADQQRLVAVIEDLSERAASTLLQSSFKLRDISALACFWVYDVDAQTGEVAETPQSSECRTSGPLGTQLSLEVFHRNLILRGVARPLEAGAEVLEFVPRVVLIGVAVGARYQGLAEYFREQLVQHGAVWIPRGDVTL